MTTDLVLVMKSTGGGRTALAIAFKPSGYAASRRTIELLKLEREFWLCRGVPWLLITPEQSDQTTVLTLRCVAAWALGDEVTANHRRVATRVAMSLPGRSLTHLLWNLADKLGALDLAQRALWQAIWIGELPADLRRDWRPHYPLSLVDQKQFSDFNPIASGRSAWT
jgi:hypothetical protein